MKLQNLPVSEVCVLSVSGSSNGSGSPSSTVGGVFSPPSSSLTVTLSPFTYTRQTTAVSSGAQTPPPPSHERSDNYRPYVQDYIINFQTANCKRREGCSVLQLDHCVQWHENFHDTEAILGHYRVDKPFKCFYQLHLVPAMN